MYVYIFYALYIIHTCCLGCKIGTEGESVCQYDGGGSSVIIEKTLLFM